MSGVVVDGTLAVAFDRTADAALLLPDDVGRIFVACLLLPGLMADGVSGNEDVLTTSTLGFCERTADAPDDVGLIFVPSLLSALLTVLEATAALSRMSCSFFVTCARTLFGPTIANVDAVEPDNGAWFSMMDVSGFVFDDGSFVAVAVLIARDRTTFERATGGVARRVNANGFGRFGAAAEEADDDEDNVDDDDDERLVAAPWPLGRIVDDCAAVAFPMESVFCSAIVVVVASAAFLDRKTLFSYSADSRFLAQLAPTDQ